MRTFLTTILGTFVALSAQAATIDTFDDFTPGFNIVSVSGGTGTDSTTDAGPLTDVIGGQRNLDIDVTTNTNGFTGSLFVAGGLLVLDQSPGVASTAEVTWDAGGAGLAFDLTADSSHSFAIDIDSIDLNVDLTFEVVDGNSTTGTLTRTNLTAGTQLFAFADFVGGADFTDIDSITLRLTTPVGTDATFNLIETTGVPEPGTVLLFGAGLIGLALRIRRRS